MDILLLLSFWLACVASGEELIADDQSCSAGKCQNGQKNGTDTLLPYPTCSCSSSCTNYGDCCRDSPFRYQSEKPHRMMCISLSGRGSFRVISQCPKEWSESSHFCTESVGYLPPVTSRTSGNSYANVYCAVCHGDSENLKTWNVDLRCCPELDDSDNTPEHRYIYRNGHLWSRISKRKKCLCQYYAHENNTDFLDNLELRTCDKSFEISECSSSWSIPVHEDLCKSFLDPVYVADVVYRNRYCAQCNFKRTEDAKCMPSVVEEKLSEGFGTNEIYQFCIDNRFSACVHYLMTFSKGKPYRFASLFDINEKSCIPPQGKRCCHGQRYNFKAKQCRTWDKKD